MSLKFHVQRVRAELELRQSEFWKNKFMFCKDDYPNLLILVELCLVIPCQTACCERGNSCMNRIMTDRRSTLNVSTIDELMRIAISGPSHEDYTAVSCSWALAGGVRTEQTAYIDGLIIAFNDHSYHLGTPN